MFPAATTEPSGISSSQFSPQTAGSQPSPVPRGQTSRRVNVARAVSQIVQSWACARTTHRLLREHSICWQVRSHLSVERSFFEGDNRWPSLLLQSSKFFCVLLSLILFVVFLLVVLLHFWISFRALLQSSFCFRFYLNIILFYDRRVGFSQDLQVVLDRYMYFNTPSPELFTIPHPPHSMTFIECLSL